MKRSLIPGVCVLFAQDEQSRKSNGQFGSGQGELALNHTAAKEKHKIDKTLEPKTSEEHKSMEKFHRSEAEKERGKRFGDKKKIEQHEAKAAHHKQQAAKLSKT